MADWVLSFQQSQAGTIDGYERALATVGGAVTTTFEAYRGNPRDFYLRTISLVAAPGPGGVRIELHLMQEARGPDDPEPVLHQTFTVALRAAAGASFATKLAAWHALRDALAAIGCADRTIDTKPTAIVAEARAAGDLETAAWLREGIAAVRKREANERRRDKRRRARDAIRRSAWAAAAAASSSAAASVTAPRPGAPPAAAPRPVRPPPQVTFQDGTLAFATGWLDAAALAALIEGGAYRGATRVHLTRAPLGDDGVAYLARSGGFPAVTELALGGTGMTDAGAIAVARQAVGLDHLAVLDLGDVPAESDARGPRDPAGVSDRGVDELARSPRLPTLRRIVRGHEHRMPCQGRDDTEIVAIRRADGRVVEAVIYHTIWP